MLHSNSLQSSLASNYDRPPVILSYISDCNWSKYKSGLDVPEFHDTVEAFQDYNCSVINKEGLDLATAGCDVSNTFTFNNDDDDDA